ncbi:MULTISPECIES: hypothetical protein [Clostridium]|uniref:Uncharacterized protein n=1 Tax=Clostridium cibarium TaxID=2762247 RepID=A0ABR8PQX0_9CLOT|nr:MULTISPECIES: hypothetical protein [Clostridium]MBD7910479.1 hypothetical protein [Clostridium cibarium]
MKTIFIVVIFFMVLFNFFCFVQSRKYLKNVTGNDEESNKNYEKALRFIKISVVISVFICLVGATAVIFIQIL